MEMEINERLARIEAKVDGVLEHVAHINGTLGRHDEVIIKIQTRCAAHDALADGRVLKHVEIDKRLEAVDLEIRDLRESRVGMTSTARTVRDGLQFAVVVVTLAISVYGASLAYHSSRPAQAPPPAAVQHPK